MFTLLKDAYDSMQPNNKNNRSYGHKIQKESSLLLHA